jgi:Glycoside hydrolase 123, N-terminal domain
MPMDEEINYNLLVPLDEQSNYSLAQSQNSKNSQKKIEIIEDYASEPEIKTFLSAHPSLFHVFGENRLHPVNRDDKICQHWIAEQSKNYLQFIGNPKPGEFYIFQMVIYTPQNDLSKIILEFQELKKGESTTNAKLLSIPPDNITCFSLGGTNSFGKVFQKDISIQSGKVKPLIIGVQIPPTVQGNYCGKISINAEYTSTENSTEETQMNKKMNFKIDFNLSLIISGKVIKDSGIHDPWRQARLKWLNSTIGRNNTIPKPFIALNHNQRNITLLGKLVTLNESGLPASIKSYYNTGNTKILDKSINNLINRPIQFQIKTQSEYKSFKMGELKFTNSSDDQVHWHLKGKIEQLELEIFGEIHFDGYMDFSLQLKSNKSQNYTIEDVRFQIPFNGILVKYMTGLGYRKGKRPSKYTWQWDKEKSQDSIWIGAVNNGLKIRFKDDNYIRQLVNIYYSYQPLNLPIGWDNSGLGKVCINEVEEGNTFLLEASSGQINLEQGKVIHFNFDISLTPSKPLDLESHWKYRYDHRGSNTPPEEFLSAGGNVFNIHHANSYNPYINYPYNDESFTTLTDFVELSHKNQKLVKVYYTTREITNHMPEFFALFNLDGEIIFPGPGNDCKTVINRMGPHPWLKKYLRKNFIPAWVAKINEMNDRLDLAVITTPETRWDNFFLEGLQYLITEGNIDGIYIDDTALGRESLLRARRILDADGKIRLIDLHSWDHFNKLAHYGDSTILYMEIYPYIDKIWFGEGFDYNENPDFWLTEIAGIPFGLMSEMLQNGGNPWRGMVYGMTNRLGWSSDPRKFWKFFDEFSIEKTEFFGYWDEQCPIRIDNDSVRATLYKGEHYSIIAIGNWSKIAIKVSLLIDFTALDIQPQKAVLFSPAIKGIQPAAQFSINHQIKIGGSRGWLLILTDDEKISRKRREQNLKEKIQMKFPNFFFRG